MISTDKAVNPTNIMGATKERICEMIIQTYNNRSKTEYVAVRFGNVLGSNGSVIPFIQSRLRQADRLPLRTRISVIYDNTGGSISCVEAGSLCRGEIFVLDMGGNRSRS